MLFLMIERFWDQLCYFASDGICIDPAMCALQPLCQFLKISTDQNDYIQHLKWASSFSALEIEIGKLNY
jgi:hypothetical protein